MKKLLLISLFLFTLSCEAIEDPPEPINGYQIVMTINSTTGEILFANIKYSTLFYEYEIKQWKEKEGTIIERDTINKTIIVTTNVLVKIDVK